MTAHSLADFYYQHDPKKTCYLRPDTLSLLLHHASLGASSRVLLIDRTNLLVACALARRMAGCGEIRILKYGGCSSFRGSVFAEGNVAQGGGVGFVGRGELGGGYSAAVLAGDFDLREGI